MPRLQRIALVVAVGFVLPLAAQEAPRLAIPESPRWGSPSLVEELRIGVLDGPEEYTLGLVGTVTALPDGTIWVGDSYMHAIRRYSSDGVYLDQIGREGQGPGEFTYPTSMRVMLDGSVAVWDAGSVRVTRFTSSGEYIDSFTPPTHMIGGSFESFESDLDGFLYLIAYPRQVIPNSQDLGEIRAALQNRGPAAWLKMWPDGEIVDTVFVEPSEREGTVDAIRTTTDISPLGYRVTSRSDEFAIRLHIDEAQPTTLHRPWDPVPYQRRERAEKQRLEEIFAERNAREERRIPANKPAIVGQYIDSEGRIWVEVYAAGYVEPDTPGEQDRRERFNGVAREWRQPLVYEVVEPNGEYLGRVQLPNRQTEIQLARGQTLWVVERGEFDEQYVVRYRIETSGEG